jgi:hypothetical protein
MGGTDEAAGTRIIAARTLYVGTPADMDAASVPKNLIVQNAAK